MSNNPPSTNPTSEASAELANPDAGGHDKAIFQVIIRAPIEKVWAELTRTDMVLPFFFNAKCATPGLAPGAPIRMQSKDGKYTSVVGEVLEWDPPYRYAHTFKFTSLDDPPCTVTYVLEPVDGGTKFTLVNTGVPSGTKTEKYMTQGGDFITKNLKAICETGKPTASGRFALMMMGIFAVFTPKRCRSENWPM